MSRVLNMLEDMPEDMPKHGGQLAVVPSNLVANYKIGVLIHPPLKK
jgi:hypothetical protein